MRWIALLSGLAFFACGSAAEIDWPKVNQAFGRKAAELPGGVRKYSLPRTDLHVTVDGVAIKPALALRALRNHGIEVTALHSHMIDDSPHLFFMHFWANDDAQRLAQGLRTALDLANVKRGS